MRTTIKIRVYKIKNGYKALGVTRAIRMLSELDNLERLLRALDLKREQVQVQGIDF